MKIALISDLHANIEALDATLSEIDGRGVDRIFCLGDIVGYHADPEACIERLRERQIRSLAGNHDRAVAGLCSTRHFGSRARRAAAWTRRQLSAESLAYLASLPVAEHLVHGCFSVHGALHPEPNADLHLSTRERVRASLKELQSGRFGARVCFFGHTHRAVVHVVSGAGVRSRDVDTETTLLLDAHAATLVNPGSVGQPRDGDPRAAFAVYDTERRTLEFVRVSYDWRACHEKARRAGLFDPEPAHRRSSVWVLSRLDGGARRLERALGRALGHGTGVLTPARTPRRA
jgi:predicted phosphodiesterase